MDTNSVVDKKRCLRCETTITDWQDFCRDCLYHESVFLLGMIVRELCRIRDELELIALRISDIKCESY